MVNQRVILLPVGIAITFIELYCEGWLIPADADLKNIKRKVTF